MTFKDHFSAQSTDYARFRPRYPAALTAALAAASPSTAVALDLATGNGQAAIDLAAHFDLVLASDASMQQLAEATQHPRIVYLRHAAECIPLRTGSADLLTVAQAAHWLDLDRFYDEARRVLQPGGVVALWTYGLFRVDVDIDAAIRNFYAADVGPYWPPERHFVDERYESLPFPLDELALPAFEITADWSLPVVISYIGTWSAVARYRVARGEDPLPRLALVLQRLWGKDATRRLRWPIHLRAGRA